MFLVTIGILDNPEMIRDDIYKQFEQADREGVDIICEDSYIGSTLFIKCGIKENIITRLTDKKIYEEFKYILSKMLTEVIIDHYEIRLIKKIAKANYYYLSERERASVVETAVRLLQEEKMMQPGGFYKATRRSKIMKCILDYLSAEDEINIEGFVNFRLSSYMNELNEVIERALEIYIAEREYNEFIKLLRYFVDIQECKMDVIHLCQSQDGRYIIYDSNKNRVNSEYFDDLRDEAAEDNINYDDLLISTLITISPNKIIIHHIDDFKNKELVQTIMNVFAERITICNDCEICSSGNKETNNYSL